MKEKNKLDLSPATKNNKNNWKVIIFGAFAHIVGMGWVQLKECNNREEAVTEVFPWEFMKPEGRKKYVDIVLSYHVWVGEFRVTPTQCYQLV